MIDFNSIDFSKMQVIRDKYNRIDESGINHGRSIYYDNRDSLYYKIFNVGYYRRKNFYIR